MGTTIPIRNQRDIEIIKEYYLKRCQYRNYALFVVGINTAVKYVEVREKKTGKQNVVFLNQNARQALKLYKTTAGPVNGNDKIFCNNRNRRVAITRTQAYAVIRKACADSGIEGKISCHSLRKTFGYHAWKRNVPEIMLMNIFNHSSFAITRCYLGIEQDDRDEVFRRLNL